MQVGIIEPGHHRAALQINDLDLVVGTKGHQRPVTADGHEAAVLNDCRFGGGFFGVESMNFSIVNNQIGFHKNTSGDEDAKDESDRSARQPFGGQAGVGRHDHINHQADNAHGHHQLLDAHDGQNGQMFEQRPQSPGHHHGQRPDDRDGGQPLLPAFGRLMPLSVGSEPIIYAASYAEAFRFGDIWFYFFYQLVTAVRINPGLGLGPTGEADRYFILVAARGGAGHVSAHVAGEPGRFHNDSFQPILIRAVRIGFNRVMNYKRHLFRQIRKGFVFLSHWLFLSLARTIRVPGAPPVPDRPAEVRFFGRFTGRSLNHVDWHGLWRPAFLDYLITTGLYDRANWEYSAKYSPNWPLKLSMTSG